MEVDPLKGAAKKLTSLGRFAHECATCITSKDGRVVVYSGDDKADQCLYKFISDRPDSLESGELFVANLRKGQWISLDIEKQPILKANFKDQTEVLTFCREAAALVGGSKLDRPEDIEINPQNGEVLVTLTNNMKRFNFHGSILKIVEQGDHSSLKFKAQDFLVGGHSTGLSSPDNLAFDRNGNLWVCSDMSSKQMAKPIYFPFKNNGLLLYSSIG